MDVLESSFMSNPDPSAEEQESLGELLKMSGKEVSAWFQNRKRTKRRRSVAAGEILDFDDLNAKTEQQQQQHQQHRLHLLDRRHSVSTLLTHMGLGEKSSTIPLSVPVIQPWR